MGAAQTFCGEGFQVWDHDRNDFNACFEDLFVWSLPPLVWLIVAGLPLYIDQRKYRTLNRRFSTLIGILFWLSVIVGVGPFLFTIMRYGKAAGLNGPPEGHQMLATGIVAISWLSTTYLLQMSLSRGFPIPLHLQLYYIINLVCDTVKFQSEARRLSDGMPFDALTHVIFFPFSVIACVMGGLLPRSIARDTYQTQNAGISHSSSSPLLIEEIENDIELGGYVVRKSLNPEIHANIFSVLSFWWLNDLLSKGNKRPLSKEDLFPPPPKYASRHVSTKFTTVWQEELRRPEPSVWRALHYSFGKPFYLAGFYKLAQDALIFVGPQLLNLIINFLGSNDDPIVGVQYVLLMFATSQIQSLILHQYFHRVFMVGMQLRASVTTAIYAKALRMSTSAKKQRSTGEIVNLMSLDAKRFQDLTPYLHMTWSAVFQVALSLYFLSVQIGVSVLAGVFMMLIMFPVNGYLAKRIKVIQKGLMEVKDQRIKTTSEVLSSIKTIKSYAWEDSFGAKIMGLRTDELARLKKYMIINVAQGSIWVASPTFIALAAFGTYSLLGNKLTAATAFTTLALFNILRFPIGMLPMVVNSLAEASVSVKRMREFLLSPELVTINATKRNAYSIHDDDDDTIKTNGSSHKLNGSSSSLSADESFASDPRKSVFMDDAISVENGNYYWDDAQKQAALVDLKFGVKKGSLTIVVGETGSGKTALLSGLIGDLPADVSRGTCEINGTIAYTSQQSWIQNASLRENILFGKPYRKEFYERVLGACALLPDLQVLPRGDDTEIGERGINLSGGQKQRVALARAVYQDTDIYLFDDPLSAVDSHVARHIFTHCFTGLLKEKTLLLVTHAINFLPQADHIMVMKFGKIADSGTYEELISRGLDFQALAKQKPGEGREDLSPTTEAILAQEEKKEEAPGEDAKSKPTTPVATPRKLQQEQKEIKGRDLTKEEERQTGSVSLKVYKEYIKLAGGYGMAFFVFVVYLLATGSNVGTNVWLSFWSTRSDSEESNNNRDLGIYSALGLGDWFFTMVASATMFMAGIKAARSLHDSVLDTMLRAPMSFFDTTPIGRILNRFSKEVYVIDMSLANSFGSYLRQLFNIFGVMAIICYVTPVFMAALVPLGFLYYYVQRYYIASSRELKRLESVSQSPIYSHFSESLDGLAVIRAFSAQKRFLKENEDRLDANLAAYYASIAANRWLALRLEFVGVIMVTLASLFAVMNRGTINPGLGGLSISYALSITSTLSWWVRMASEMETNIVSVERVLEFLPPSVPQEAEAIIVDKRPPINWPTQGRITFKNLKMRYREGLDLVLKGINCEIKPKEKVGVVGRTGAGKSSVYLALLRLVEPALESGGKILVDGLDIGTIGLQDLRSRISIIPQDPVCFTGTIRFNLDPFRSHKDAEIWEALKYAGLQDHVQTMENQLDAELTEGGGNLSMGQRQLLCLARALLRKSAILLLDEATSAVDYKTDNMLQETIRTQFADCTVLTIAHRINTIMGSDRVFVLDEGRIVEQGSPAELLKDKSSRFYALCQALEENS